MTDRDQAHLQLLGIATSGYALGFIVSCFVYREGTSMISRGICNSIDSLVKCDKNLSFNNPYVGHPSKIVYIVQSLLQNQVVNMLDVAVCIVVLAISAFLLLSNSAEIVTTDTNYKALLAPTLYLSMNVLCQVLVQLFKTWFDDSDGCEYIKYNTRLLVILANIVSMIVFMTMPVITLLEEMTMLGTGAPDSITTATISIKNITLACIIGQFGNVSLLMYTEWITSHGCRPLRNMVLASTDRVPIQGLLYGEYLGGLGSVPAMLILSLVIITSYSVAGWVGFMAAATGFMANFAIYVPIMYVGAMAADAYKLCCMGMVNTAVTDKLYRLAWAGRMYAVYLRVTTLGGAILLSLSLLGTSMFYFQQPDTNIFLKGTGIFGILLGIMLTLAYRGWNLGAIIYISKIYVSDCNQLILDRIWICIKVEQLLKQLRMRHSTIS